jgi:hypothetical protein
VKEKAISGQCRATVLDNCGDELDVCVVLPLGISFPAFSKKVLQLHFLSLQEQTFKLSVVIAAQERTSNCEMRQNKGVLFFGGEQG